MVCASLFPLYSCDFFSVLTTDAMAVISIGPSLETVLTPNNPWWLADPMRD